MTSSSEKIAYPENDECPECGTVCKSEKGLKMHFTRQHSGKKRGNQFPWEAEGDVECPTCGRLCSDVGGMHRHHMWEHGVSISKTERTCTHCGKRRELYVSKDERLSTTFCQECIENQGLGDKHPSSRERDPEVMERVAEAQRGSDVPDHVVEAAKKGWNNWWENEADQEAHIKRLQDASPDAVSEEARQKISETLMGHEVSEERRQKIRENSTPGRLMSIEVEETGNIVRSTWEEEVDLILHASTLDYEYEPKAFDIGESTYLPDFIVDKTVIEVKGWANEHSIDRAQKFMDEYPHYRYLVLGDSDVPHDTHIRWGDRSQLVSTLKE